MFSALIILAFVVRLALMPISVHSDLFFINYFPNLIYTKNVFDIFSFTHNDLSKLNVSYYPPITFYFFGLFQYFYHFLSQSFSPWMTQIYNLRMSGVNGQSYDYLSKAPNEHIYKDIFLAKFPYLLFDLSSIYVIMIYAKKHLLRKNAILVWLFNPVILYGVYLMGQYDVIPAFFVLLSFLLIRKNVYLGIIVLGVAAAFKNFAFIFILPTILIYMKSPIERLKLAIVSFLPYFVFLCPTLIHDPTAAIFSFLPKVYLSYRKPLEDWALYSQYIKYGLFMLGYGVFLTMSFSLKSRDKWRLAVGLCLASILLFFSFAPRISFHYLLWGVPLIIIWYKNSKTSFLIILIQSISLASYKLLAIQLQLGLFAPINLAFSVATTFNGYVNNFFPYRIISTMGYFIFLFTNLFLITQIILNLLFSEPALVKNIEKKRERKQLIFQSS